MCMCFFEQISCVTFFPSQHARTSLSAMCKATKASMPHVSALWLLTLIQTPLQQTRADNPLPKDSLSYLVRAPNSYLWRAWGVWLPAWPMATDAREATTFFDASFGKTTPPSASRVLRCTLYWQPYPHLLLTGILVVAWVGWNNLLYYTS